MMKLFSVRSAVALVVAALAFSPAGAMAYTLTEGNSSVVIDPASSAGISSWTVDSVDHLNYQWLWYRVGSDREYSFDNLTLTGATLFPGNVLTASYADPVNQFTIDVQWILVGGDYGQSDLSTSIRVHNAGGSPLDIAIFQYSDFDLYGTPNNDTVEIDGPDVFNTARQFEGATKIQESVAVTIPDIYVADLIDGSGDLLSLLNDGSASAFSPNVTGPLGPGNASWLFGWTSTVAAGADMTTIAKDQRIVPEPATALMLLMPMAGLLLGRRRR